MLRVIGDIHGKVPEYYKRIKSVAASVQLGDFGFAEQYKYANRLFDQMPEHLSKEHFMIPGNHEQYDGLPSFSLGDFGSRTINDITFFFIRGAYSIDKDTRVFMRDWFPNEELSMLESINCISAYEKALPDIVLSHDAPYKIIRDMHPYYRIDNTQTGSLLQELFDLHEPKLWVFGHHHITMVEEYGNTKFICLGELDFLDILDESTLRLKDEVIKF